MKFNEKLIKLRKENGMSQEQLGFELNVTRQTVSKWELGISTPEMDKLIEISKLFGVSVDELVNEGNSENMSGNYQTNNNDYVGVDSKYIPKNASNNNTNYNPEKEKEIKKRKRFTNGYFAFFGILIVMTIMIFVISAFMMFKHSKKMDESKNEADSRMEEMQEDSQENSQEKMENKTDNYSNEIDNLKETIEESTIKADINYYNAGFEMFGGISQNTVNVETLINKIIVNNNSNKNKIIVNYNGQELKENNEIENIELEEGAYYKVSFEYNSEGYIKESIITKK